MSILQPESIIFTFNLFIFSSEILEKNEVDVPKAVLVLLPIVFSQAGRTAAALDLLRSGSFRFPQFQRRFPKENWDQLFSVSYEACKLAIASEGENLAITMGGASDNDTERENVAIATECHGASDNATERDDLAIATEGATGSDNATERDNLAIATEGDMSELTIVTGTKGDNLAISMDVDASDNTATERDNLVMTAEGDKPTIPESYAEIGTSSRGSGLEWLLQVVRIILELILGTFSIHL